MVYFLVNNNIHLLDAEAHLSNLAEHKIALIRIPHKLTISSIHAFDFEVEYPYLIGSAKDYFNLRRIHKIHKKIRQDFANVNDRDTLIFYTEFEYLNHYIIKLFKNKGAKVIMLEEGLPTYESLLNKSESKSGIKEKMVQYYFNYVLGYTNTLVAKVNNIVRPRVTDKYIDKVLLYNNAPVERDLKTYLLKRRQYTYTNPDKRYIIFLNEKMYDYYVSMDEYKLILTDILSNLSENFDTVYFKFHPREKQPQRDILLEVTNTFERVTVLNDDRPVELLINELRVKYIASFLAQTLLNHSCSNCVVLYLFHLYPEISQNPVFKNLKRLLDSLNYQFFKNWSGVKLENVGFSKDAYKNSSESLNVYI